MCLSTPPLPPNPPSHCSFGGEKSSWQPPALHGAQGGRRASRQPKRAGFSGSTLHLDGCSTYCAAGYLVTGKKSIIAVKAADSLRAMRAIGFKTYAKPSGSSHVLNPVLEQEHLNKWDDMGVTWSR